MKINKLLVVAVLMTPLVVFGTAAADESDTNAAADQTQTTTELKRKTGNEGLSLQQRLEKYKTEAKTRLNNAQKVRIQARCKASQGIVGRIETKLGIVEANRTKAYDGLTSRLTTLSTKLKAKNLDTAALDAQIAELKTKVETFHADLAKYKEATADIADMDCTTDPDAFKASLETARTLRAKVVADGQAIKTFLSDTIKPTLQALRAQLANATKQEEQ